MIASFFFQIDIKKVRTGRFPLFYIDVILNYKLPIAAI